MFMAQGTSLLGDQPSAEGERSISHGSVGQEIRGRFASYGEVILPHVAARRVLREIDRSRRGDSPGDRFSVAIPGSSTSIGEDDLPNRIIGPMCGCDGRNGRRPVSSRLPTHLLTRGSLPLGRGTSTDAARRPSERSCRVV